MELVQTFNKTLNDFTSNLKKCFPEHTKSLQHISMNTDTRPLQKFMKGIGNNMEKISTKDTTIFDEPFLCLDGCDLSTIWFDSKSEKNCEAIWKYLQTLALLGTTIRSKSTNLEDFFDQFDNDKMFDMNTQIQDQMLNLVNKLLQENDQVEIEELNENDNTENVDDSGPLPDMADMDSQYKEMFQNTKIGNLAKEIAEDIDMSPFEDLTQMDSPDISTIMQKLVGGGGLKQLIQTVANKLKKKMESGDVNQDELIGEVHEMMEKMKKDKKFKKMFKSKDVEGIFKEFMKQKGQNVSDDTEDFGALEEMFKNMEHEKAPRIPPQTMRGGARRNSARNKLRRKLAARKKENQETTESTE